MGFFDSWRKPKRQQKTAPSVRVEWNAYANYSRAQREELLRSFDDCVATSRAGLVEWVNRVEMEGDRNG